MNVVNFNVDFATPTRLVSPPRRMLVGGKRVLLVFLFAAGFALLMSKYVITTARIISESMSPELRSGDIVLVSRRAYIGGNAPKSGDVVLVRLSSGAMNGEKVVRRIAAVPGDVVSANDTKISVNGRIFGTKPSLEGGRASLTNGSFESPAAPSNGEALKPGEYFLLNDYSLSGKDSREFGPVSINDIQGKVVLVYWSWNGSGIWPNLSRVGMAVK